MNASVGDTIFSSVALLRRSIFSLHCTPSEHVLNQRCHAIRFNRSRTLPFRLYAAASNIPCSKSPKKRHRLDEICLEKFPQYSRTLIQSWILQGKVLVDGRVASKAGMSVSDKADVKVTATVPKYVCRAGYKLEAAIEKLNIDVSGKVVLDSGLSTGGFTDCLLQHGASFVYGVDVGYGQVAHKIRMDERVCVVERTNLRYLPGLPQKVDLVTLDLSFISILLVMPAVIEVMKLDATLVTLIKPQFEARRNQEFLQMFEISKKQNRWSMTSASNLNMKH